MAKAPSKTTNSNASSSTMKRKEIGNNVAASAAVADAITTTATPAAPSSILPKKGRYKDDHDHVDTKSLKESVVSSNGTTSVQQQPVPQNTVHFTFGAVPNVVNDDDAFKATIIICKRTTLQQILSEGNQLLNAMLCLNLSTNVLQSMFTDCGSSSSKGASVASTYVDHPALNVTHHKLYFITIPDVVSRCNHSWSVHAISDAIKSTVGGSSCSTNSRIICCGTGVADVMGSLTASIARAFSVFTRKTKKMSSDDVVSPTPVVPRIHVSFMDVSDSGIQESIPTNNGDHLLYVCESIHLAARLADMVRVCSSMYIHTHIYIYTL